MSAVTVSIVLARGGSKGVPGKNLRRVGGISLIARSVIAASQSKEISGVYVSTDDEAIAAEASAFGARVINRPAELSGDTATSESGWLHALEVIRKEHPDVARLVLLQCTCPFTSGADIDGCLAAMIDRDAACSLSVVEDLPFLWTFGSDGMGRGVNHDEKKQRPRRQDLGPCFRESGAIYCVRVPDFERAGLRFCGPVALFPVHHPPVDIDTPDDLALCDLIARNRLGPADPTGLRERLQAVRALVSSIEGVHKDDLVSAGVTGIEAAQVSHCDELGIEMLSTAGRWKLGFLSKEHDQVVLSRDEKLKMDCLNAAEDEVGDLESWLAREKLSWDEVLYVGNDLDDIEALERCGVAACPQDATPAVQAACDWIVPVDGGKGVLRAITDQLMLLCQRPLD